MAFYKFASNTMPWLYPFTGTASTPWFYPFTTGTHGTFTLFSQALTAANVADTNPYTMGVQFSVNTSGTLNAMWFYSNPGAGSIPTAIALYTAAGVLVHTESATWSGAVASGWVRAPFTSAPSVTASVAYVGAVFNSNAGAHNWYADIAHYWDSGAGSGGITSGSLSAPNNAGAVNGQDIFTQSGVLAFPATSFNATNYLVDVEVTT